MPPTGGDRLRSRGVRRLCLGGALLVAAAAIGVAVTWLSSGEPSPALGYAVRSPEFATLPASLRGARTTYVQLDAHRAIAFGDVTWNETTLTVVNDGVLVDFSRETATKIHGPMLDDGLARVGAVVAGSKVLFFGTECASGTLPSSFDGESGDLADPCPDAPLMLITLDVATGTWSKPVTAPAPVGGKVRWLVDATMVGRTAVIEWFRSGSAQETFTAYDTATGTWRSLDDIPGQPYGWSCSTDRYVVRQTHEDFDGGPDTDRNPRILLLDPRAGAWTTVPLPKRMATSGEFGLACAANRIAVRTVVPPFAYASAEYLPATRQWRQLPPPPHDPLGRLWLGVGNVVVAAATIGAPPSAHVQTLDLSQPVREWKPSGGLLAPSQGAVAMGVHPDGHVIERLGDSLAVIDVPTS
jgi:hypothetical protein